MIAQIRALASDLMERAGIASAAGLTFGGSRDLYSALGYQRKLLPKDYKDRYLRNGIAARVVEAYPKATWRGGAELIEDEDPEISTPFEEAWSALDERLNVWSAFGRADTLAGLGRFAALLIGAEGELEQELPRLKTPECILFLAPYGEEEVGIDALVDNPEDPRFGLPLMYRIKRSGSQKHFSKQVHWTRVLHIADGVLDDRVNGIPRLERVWNWLDDLEKVTGGGSEAFWLRVNQGLVFNIEKDVKIEQPQIDKLKEEAEELAHGLRRTLAARGFEVEALGSTVSNFTNQVTSLMSLVSGASGIPQRILLGSERGELASTQDKKNWDERVTDRRHDYAEPIVRTFADRLIEHGALPEPKHYDVRWPEIEDLDETQKAEVASTWSKLNAQAGGVVVLPEEIRDRVLGLEKLEEVAEPPTTAQGVPGEAVRQVADAHMAGFVTITTNATKKGQEALDVASLESEIAERSEARAEFVVGYALAVTSTWMQRKFPEVVRETLTAGGVVEARTAREAGEFKVAQIGFDELYFDQTNPKATLWAGERSSTLVTRVTEETRAAIRVIIRQSFAEGIPADQAARMIRQLIGLLTSQAQAVMKIRAEILANPGAKLWAGRVPIRVPKEGATIEWLERRMGQYSARLLNQRARMIARTETIAASNEGQRQLWGQAQAKGLLSLDRLKEWIPTPDDRLCAICEALGGVTALIDEPFPDIGVQGPPAHPGCRCGMGISAKRAKVQVALS